MDGPRVRRALISVSNKLGLVDFARGLVSAGVEIYSTGGTRRHLESDQIAAREIADYTGFPEMLGGRLKTLHPKVFGGILCRFDCEEDVTAIEEFGICGFELVVVNLYPFEATVAREDVTPTDAIEQIDIGGPSLVRAAAKNHAFVTVATNPEQYSSILDQISAQSRTTLELRQRLAAEAFVRTAQYDQAISEYLGKQFRDDEFLPTIHLALRRKNVLRYGENPHQRAALYASDSDGGANLVSARQRHGKELSFNNLLDLDSALVIVRSLPDCATVVVKHNNPCGAASAETLSESAARAIEGDPVSAFGSVLGFNHPVDTRTAEVLTEPNRFIEAIVAPDFEDGAVQILTTRPKWKNNVRLVQVGGLDERFDGRQYRNIAGGFLVQDADHCEDPPDTWKVVTQRHPTDKQMEDLRFAWSVVRHVKSNAILLARERAVCGVGAGQMSRIDSASIAIHKAGSSAAGSVMGSDAFFPFADSIDLAAKAGVTAIIQPGGSRRDDEVIAACDEHDMTMVFTGRRHFRH